MNRKELKHRILLVLASTLAAWILKALLATLRMRIIGSECFDFIRESKKGAVFAFWHSRILYMLVPSTRGVRVHTLVSQNRDGEYIARIAAQFGRLTVRGSSSRGGGKALLAMARLIQDGDSVAFTPDGPRGPREVFQPGAVQLARITGRPLYPVAYSVKRKKIFGSWDGFMLPYPFSGGVFIVGDPILPGDFSEGDEGFEAMRDTAEKALRDLTFRADQLAAEA